ncbi:MAG: adenosylcobinamide-phosphate synthase CbiB [Alphaproteobacteria bacterium]|nr:adenosylcobinamide-phosphate synthase CbiB [Alphaproteobacteria bacterium]
MLLALALDWLIGDPAPLYRRIPHPVAAIGALIAALDARFNRGAVWPGVLVAILVVGLSAAAGWVLAWGCRAVSGGWAIEALAASVLLGYRGLHDAARNVAQGLEESLEAGREAVSHIVGRDPASLDECGVARAAIESLAENLSDGVVAPLFWYLVLGLPGMLAYKAVNTLDSMIGHRTPRHEAFGTFAARLDDAANWPAARLTGLVLCLVGGGWRTLRRDAGKTVSPNAGWPEAAMAGALGVALAGPRAYAGKTIDAPWLGDGRREASAGDIRRALCIYRHAGIALAIVLGGLAIISL